MPGNCCYRRLPDECSASSTLAAFIRFSDRTAEDRRRQRRKRILYSLSEENIVQVHECAVLSALAFFYASEYHKAVCRERIKYVQQKQHSQQAAFVLQIISQSFEHTFSFFFEQNAHNERVMERSCLIISWSSRMSHLRKYSTYFRGN